LELGLILELGTRTGSKVSSQNGSGTGTKPRPNFGTRTRNLKIGFSLGKTFGTGG